MKLTEAIGMRINGLLKEKGLKQYDIAKEGGIPRSTLSVTVGAKRKTVKLDTIYQICATLGITLKEFFDDPVFDEVDD